MISRTPDRRERDALHERENEVAAALVVYLRQQQIGALEDEEEDSEESGREVLG